MANQERKDPTVDELLDLQALLTRANDKPPIDTTPMLPTTLNNPSLANSLYTLQSQV